MRFSKVVFPTTYTPPNEFSLPLGKNDFPIEDVVSEALKNSFCPTVIDKFDFFPRRSNIENLINAVGSFPTHPSCDPSNPFWDEMREVIEVTIKRENNDNTCEVLELPDIWAGYSLSDVATTVHDEYPGENQAILIESFLAQGMTIDEDIIPKHSAADFVRGPVMLAHINTWAVSAVGKRNFQAKWHVGRARPEEVAFRLQEMILNGDTSCFPSDFPSLMSQLSFSHQHDFTAYPEGSPMHPSWPAMHSAASSLSLWLPVVANLTPEQERQAKLVDYGVAYGRTVAGVHYDHDNVMGLALGQEIIAQELPKYLKYVFGSDVDKVEQKLATKRFDWHNYQNQVGCTD